MNAVAEALARLDERGVARVLRWAADRFGIETRRRGTEGGPSDVRTDGVDDFADLADLFDAAGPATDNEKVLVVGYWFKDLQGHDTLDAQLINSQLKQLGHGVSNVTRAFDRLMEPRPRLAIQVQKSGRSRQARKKYKITNEGIRKVRAMVAREPEEGE